ncbi:MAG: hypothetical protein EAZ70_01280 [Runella slithyformis]|jgi:hypothetical protein|nr:MAG: hypothetical protein EAZ80_00090 [Runella slithyformis]TAF94614.1 MAG: hypothetical protein EAZ46_09820 [Runella sp.]TAG17937.1 MAG: hypothetical protein EAZ38_16235 [Cytophagales bacterium]TAG37451.1 MAG: hypothetical protein EAZ32_15415 [Cytophagia bacterium]TAF29746.1 MAG: hypothetical protein EAZ70_01280 [Runella slithyformis]
MKRNTVLLGGILGIALMSGCTYQKSNNIEQSDYRDGDQYVYGVHPDSAAAQTKNVYKPKPELDARTAAIREKMFGAGSINQGN